MGSEAGGGYLSRAYAGGLPPHAGGNGRAVPDAHRGRPLTFCPCRTGGSSRRDGCGGHSRVPPPTTGPPTDTATTGPPLPSPGTSPRYLPFRMKPPRPHRHRHRRLLMARCPASRRWQVLGLGEVGDLRVGVAEVDLNGAVPGQVLVGPDGVVLDPVVLDVGGQVDRVGDLFEEQPLVLQGAEAAFA